MDLIIFITEKINGDMKAIKVGVGSNQRIYDRHNNSTGLSSTVNTGSVFLIVLIYAHKNRAVAMLDIENAFLHAENDEYVLIMIRGNLAEILVKVYPKLYRKYVIKLKQGVTML